MSSNPIIYVDLIYTPEPEDYTGPRWQPYTVEVKAANNEPLLKSTESYTNRGDIIDMISKAFGPASNVYLREKDQEQLTVRLGTPIP